MSLNRILFERVLALAAPLFMATSKLPLTKAKKPAKKKSAVPATRPARAKPASPAKPAVKSKKPEPSKKQAPVTPTKVAPSKPALGKVAPSKPVPPTKPAPPAPKSASAPNAPKPSAPSGRALLLSPEDGKFADSVHPRFRWLSVGGATRYQVEWSPAPDFSESHLVASIATEAVVPAEKPLTFGVTYYWRVRGGNEGGWGPWSGSASFRVIEGTE